MTAVLVAVNRLAPSLAAEARAACRRLEVAALDWSGGAPPAAPLAVIDALPAGQRRIPEELVALLEGAPATRLVLCAQEPLVKPRVVLYDGRVTMLSPPTDSVQLAAALRAALDEPPPQPPALGERRFEVLRRTHWVAWTRGRGGPPISLHEERGTTVVIGDLPTDRAALAHVMATSRSDEQREQELAATKVAVAHLTADAGEWVVYWPESRPLWICSRHRLPARWNGGVSLTASRRRLLRMPAFPDDQLVAAWSTGDANDALSPVVRCMQEAGPDTLAALAAVTEQAPSLTGLVMELR